jgi:hypothetical protein
MTSVMRGRDRRRGGSPTLGGDDTVHDGVLTAGACAAYTSCCYIMTARTEKRTQIYLTAAQHRIASALARDRGTSLAGVVREALDEYFARRQDGVGVTWDGDPALALVGALPLAIRSPEESLDDAIDRAVYEEDTAPWSSPTAPGSSPPSIRASRGTRKPPRPGGTSRTRASGSSPRTSSSPRR